AELAQCGEMEVDGSISDAASPKVGYERVPQAVQERATEQDRDPARPGVHVDLVDAGTVHVGRIEDQLARLLAVGHPYAVQLQQATHDLHIPDAWHVVEAARRLAEQRRDHRLRYEVLGTPHPDLALERRIAVDDEKVIRRSVAAHGVGQRSLPDRAGVPVRAAAARWGCAPRGSRGRPPCGIPSAGAEPAGEA